MGNPLVSVAKRLRENYYGSLFLSAVTKPIHSVCASVARQIQTKVRKNGARFRLPNGQIMQVGRDSGIALASALFWHGIECHEPDTSKALRFFFERSEVFLDAGANYGLYSLLGALWNPALRVVAFEPLTPIYEGLRRNVALNQLEARIKCENMALASRSGVSTFYVPDAEGKDLESTGTLSVNSWQVRQHARPLQVATIRFDEYELSHPMRVDLIKIDVEDFEADVLHGMERVIRRDKPFIVCEILPRNREHRNERTRQVIQSLNYTPYWITPAGYIRVSHFDFERAFTTFLLSPVSVPAEVLPDPSLLWELKERLTATEDAAKTG